MVKGLVSVVSGRRETTYEEDVLAVPAFLVKWEFILFAYFIFLIALVWYIANYMLTSEPESFLGLPKPVAGALMISLTWIITNFVVASAYYVFMKRRIELIRRGGM